VLEVLGNDELEGDGITNVKGFDEVIDELWEEFVKELVKPRDGKNVPTKWSSVVEERRLENWSLMYLLKSSRPPIVLGHDFHPWTSLGFILGLFGPRMNSGIAGKMNLLASKVGPIIRVRLDSKKDSLNRNEYF